MSRLTLRLALVAMALLAADLLGWLVVFRAEGATILCGLTLLMLSRLRWGDTPPFLQGLGASLVFAGAFDWMDWGPPTPSGDWLSGFFIGALIFLPGPFLVWFFPPKDERKKPVAALTRFSLSAALILGSFLLVIARNPETGLNDFNNDGIVWSFWIGLAVSLMFQARQRNFRLRTLLLDLALAFLFALALVSRPNSLSLCLAYIFGAFGLAAWVTFRPSSGSPKTGRFVTASGIALLFLPWLAILWFGTMGILGSLYNLEITRMVAWHESILNLSRESFAWLVMRDVYLWNDKLPDSPPPAKSAASMIRQLRMPEDKYSGAFPHKIENAIRKGWGVRVFSDDNENLRVAYVIPNSPAGRAGVQRGWGIIRPHAGEVQAIFIDHSGRKVSVPVGQIDDREFPMRLLREGWGGATVGYMHLPMFDERYAEHLQNVFSHFKNQGVSELIIDLRNNPGGRADMTVALANLVVGESKRGAVFNTDRFNKRYSDMSRRDVILRPSKSSLNLSRIFVLTNSDTCSASELFINGMRTFVKVVVIGDTTCGKPFGFRAFDYKGMTYEVLSFSVLATQGRGDYVNGINPTCRVEDDLKKPMGAVNDPLITAARRFAFLSICHAE